MKPVSSVASVFSSSLHGVLPCAFELESAHGQQATAKIVGTITDQARCGGAGRQNHRHEHGDERCHRNDQRQEWLLPGPEPAIGTYKIVARHEVFAR